MLDNESHPILPTQQLFGTALRNKRFIACCAGLILLWLVASSVLFHYFESTSDYGWLSSFYFTVINVTTVGFGDIVPKTALGKSLAMANSVIGVVSFGVFVAIISAALQPSQLSGVADIDQESKSDKSSVDAKPVPLQFLSSLAKLIDLDDRENSDVHVHVRYSPLGDEVLRGRVSEVVEI